MKSTKFFLVFLIFLLSFQFVLSLDLHGERLSPIIASPGKEIVNHYIVSGTSKEVEVKIGGELSEYISTTDVIDNEFDLLIKFPQELPGPGEYAFTLAVSELLEEEGAPIASLVSLNLRFTVEIPPHGKYLSISVKSSNVNEKQPVPLTVVLTSKGLENMASVGGVLSVYDGSGTSVGVFTVPLSPLVALGSQSYDYSLNTEFLTAGKFRAEALISYDGDEQRAETQFKIGDLDVILIEYTDEWQRGFTEFTATVENNWGNSVGNVYGILYLNGQQLLQTPTISLEPWSRADLQGILKIDLPPGQYAPSLELHYQDQSKQEQLVIQVVDSSAGALVGNASTGGFLRSVPWFPITVGIVLSIALIILIILLLRKKKENEGPTESEDNGRSSESLKLKDDEF
jgi:hypothetical protein